MLVIKAFFCKLAFIKHRLLKLLLVGVRKHEESSVQSIVQVAWVQSRKGSLTSTAICCDDTKICVVNRS